MKAEKNHDRAEGQSALTFSLPKELKDRIEEAAAKERRSKSNWITLAIEKILEAHEAARLSPRTAEDSTEYGKGTK